MLNFSGFKLQYGKQTFLSLEIYCPGIYEVIPSSTPQLSFSDSSSLDGIHALFIISLKLHLKAIFIYF